MLGQRIIPGVVEAYPIQDLVVTPGCDNTGVVSWKVADSFKAPLPHIFTVEWSNNASSMDSEWAAVSAPTNNVTAISIPMCSRTSNEFTDYYRVKMVTPIGTYKSYGVSTFELLNKKEYLIAAAIIRKETLAAKNRNGNRASVYLKRKTGIPCTECVDPITGESNNSDCPTCLGTGFVSGFHGPYPTYIVASLKGVAIDVAADGLGTEDKANIASQFRMIAVPQLSTGDVICDDRLGRFYSIHTIQHAVEMRRIPIILNVVAEDLSPTDAREKLKDL